MKLKYKSTYFAMLVVSLALLVSCKKAVNDYLDDLPSKGRGIPVTSTAELDVLLNDYQTMGVEYGGIFRVLASDDFGLSPTLPTDAPFYYNNLRTFYLSTWDRKYMSDLNNDDWTSQWGKIFTANLILNSLPEVNGTEADKARLKADAHFVRAFAYWVLANTYCLPYTLANAAINKDAQGLPIKQTTSFEENVTRAPLSKVYEMIEADLEEALKTTIPLFNNGIAKALTPAIFALNAFAARYYLNIGDYTKAESYATVSLNAHNTMMDYNNRADIDYQVAFPIFPNIVDVPPVLFKGVTSFRALDNVDIIVPSADLLSLFDTTNDQRYVYNIVEGGGEANGFPNIPLIYAGVGGFETGQSYFLTGTTVGETMLTKAEALARLNRVSEAMAVVNQLRVNRIKPGAPNLSLIANTREDAVREILKERRRELPLALRWFDMRRLNHNEDLSDNQTYTRTFYQYDQVGIQTTLPQITYTLAPGSDKYAFMIPNTDIIASGGIITQNNYTK